MSNSIHRITRALCYLWVPVCIYLAGPAMASSGDTALEYSQKKLIEKLQKTQPKLAKILGKVDPENWAEIAGMMAGGDYTGAVEKAFNDNQEEVRKALQETLKKTNPKLAAALEAIDPEFWGKAAGYLVEGDYTEVGKMVGEKVEGLAKAGAETFVCTIFPPMAAVFTAAKIADAVLLSARDMLDDWLMKESVKLVDAYKAGGMDNLVVYLDGTKGPRFALTNMKNKQGITFEQAREKVIKKIQDQVKAEKELKVALEAIEQAKRKLKQEVNSAMATARAKLQEELAAQASKLKETVAAARKEEAYNKLTDKEKAAADKKAADEKKAAADKKAADEKKAAADKKAADEKVEAEANPDDEDARPAVVTAKEKQNRLDNLKKAVKEYKKYVGKLEQQKKDGYSSSQLDKDIKDYERYIKQKQDLIRTLEKAAAEKAAADKKVADEKEAADKKAADEKEAADLHGQEPPVDNSGSMPPPGENITDQFIENKNAKNENKYKEGIIMNNISQQVADASNAGNAAINQAAQTVNAGGLAGQDITNASVSNIKQIEDANKNPILEGIVDGIGEGVGATVASFSGDAGAALGEQIFEPEKKCPPPPTGGDESSTTGSEQPSSAPGSGNISSPETESPPDTGSGDSKKPEKTTKPETTTTTEGAFICANCGKHCHHLNNEKWWHEWWTPENKTDKGGAVEMDIINYCDDCRAEARARYNKAVQEMSIIYGYAGQEEHGKYWAEDPDGW